MSVPGFSAEVSMYSSTNHYHSTWMWGGTSAVPLGSAEMAALPLPNGGFCKPHIGPCTIPDPDCPTGKSRFIQTADCEGDTHCCTPVCTTTCGACSGTKTCTDCHGVKTTQPC